MNIKHSHRLLVLGSILALGGSAMAQTNTRSASLAESDPSGLVMTTTAVAVVFSSLLLLSIIFRLVGNLMTYLSERGKTTSSETKAEYSPARPSSSNQKPSGEALVAIALALDAEQRACTDEVAIAISMAISAYAQDQHDDESYVLTFGARRPSGWNARHLGLRASVHR